MVDEYDKHSCEFKNESECEEELDSEGYDFTEEEENHYEEETK